MINKKTRDNYDYFQDQQKIHIKQQNKKDGTQSPIE
jgi:hypothetical protein